MNRIVLAAGAAALAALVVVTAGFGGSTAVPALKATVGPGYTINLTTQAGQKVKTLKPGTYRIAISDRSGEHNFVLGRSGATPQQLTTVGWSGSKTVTVKLTNGTWTYFCAPHSSVMVGKFGVGGAASATAAPPAASNTSSGGDDDGPGDD